MSILWPSPNNQKNLPSNDKNVVPNKKTPNPVKSAILLIFKTKEEVIYSSTWAPKLW